MIRSLGIFILVTTVSCTGAGKKISPPGYGEQYPESEVFSDKSGVYLTFIGTLGDNIPIKSPWGISFGIDGTLYVCDRDNSSIVRLDRNGSLITQFSGFDSRTEGLFLPVDISVSEGIEIYALDGADSQVFRFDRNLKNAYVVYKPEAAREQFFGTFSGIVFDKTSGDLFITDRDNGTVIRIDMLGGNVHTTGEFGSERRSLREPAGLDVGDDGTLFIADSGTGAVGVIPHFGSELTFIGEHVLEAPVDVAVVPGNLVAVADRRGVVLLNRSGKPVAAAGFGIERDMNPRSVAFFDGKLYIGDARSSSILVYKIDKR